MRTRARLIATIAVCLWMSLANAHHLAADPPSRQSIESEQQSHQEPERPSPKLKRNDELENIQQRQKEIDDMLEKGKENLKKLDEYTKKHEKEEAEQAQKIAEYQAARKKWGREWWPLERIVLVGVVGVLVMLYRAFKNPEP